MAYISQEEKAQIVAQLKRVIPRSWKWTTSVQNHSTLCLNITSAPVNLIEEYTSRKCSDEVRDACRSQMHMQCNPYWWREHFEGELLGTFAAIMAAMNDGNHDRSDLQTDYHDVGWYVQINFGKWNKPFTVTQELRHAA